MPSIVRRLFADQRPVAMLEYGLIVAMSSVGRDAMNMLGPGANALT